MITCPSCQHEEFIGALFCSQCGTKLSYQKPTPLKTAVYPGDIQTGSQPPSPEPVPQTPSMAPKDHILSLKILDTGVMIPLEGGTEFTLGRVSGNQPILPDLDLTPFKAYESGVSRLHATIRIEQGIVTVTDLGSANGTRVNGKKLPEHTSLTIKDGDMITLGKFKLQVLIRN